MALLKNVRCVCWLVQPAKSALGRGSNCFHGVAGEFIPGQHHDSVNRYFTALPGAPSRFWRSFFF